MAKVVLRYNMFLNGFLGALIPQRLAVQFCRLGVFLFSVLAGKGKMKKKYWLLGFAGMLFVSARRRPSHSGRAGEDYTNIGVGFWYGIDGTGAKRQLE